MKKEFKLTQLNHRIDLPIEYFADLKVSMGHLSELTDEVTLLFKGYFYRTDVNKSKVTINLPKPSFLDFILRRERKIEVDIEYYDVLQNPPKPNETKRMYDIVKK
jgi:hypothetical protein